MRLAARRDAVARSHALLYRRLRRSTAVLFSSVQAHRRHCAVVHAALALHRPPRAMVSMGSRGLVLLARLRRAVHRDAATVHDAALDIRDSRGRMTMLFSVFCASKARSLRAVCPFVLVVVRLAAVSAEAAVAADAIPKRYHDTRDTTVSWSAARRRCVLGLVGYSVPRCDRTRVLRTPFCAAESVAGLTLPSDWWRSPVDARSRSSSGQPAVASAPARASASPSRRSAVGGAPVAQQRDPRCALRTSLGATLANRTMHIAEQSTSSVATRPGLVPGTAMFATQDNALIPEDFLSGPTSRTHATLAKLATRRLMCAQRY